VRAELAITRARVIAGRGAPLLPLDRSDTRRAPWLARGAMSVRRAAPARRSLLVATALTWLSSLAAPALARAHVCMDSPTSRVGAGCSAASPQKVGPCGVASRSQYVTTFRPGETITVALNETINHPSHYRIAFNPDGDSFEDPTSVDDKSGAHPYVLLDGIADADDAKQTVQVTLPNVVCTRCTLQLIQVMYDKGGNGFGGNDGAGPATDNDDLYYACADLVLEGEPMAADAGSSGDGGAPSSDAGAVRADAGTALPGADAGAPTPPPSASGGNDAGSDGGPEKPSDSGGCSLARAEQPGSAVLSGIMALGALALLQKRGQRRRMRSARGDAPL
jgi:hypothetical protein